MSSNEIISFYLSKISNRIIQTSRNPQKRIKFNINKIFHSINFFWHKKTNKFRIFKIIHKKSRNLQRKTNKISFRKIFIFNKKQNQSIQINRRIQIRHWQFHTNRIKFRFKRSISRTFYLQIHFGSNYSRLWNFD